MALLLVGDAAGLQLRDQCKSADVMREAAAATS
jgi:hypothetical protein